VRIIILIIIIPWANRGMTLMPEGVWTINPETCEPSCKVALPFFFFACVNVYVVVVHIVCMCIGLHAHVDTMAC